MTNRILRLKGALMLGAFPMALLLTAFLVAASASPALAGRVAKADGAMSGAKIPLAAELDGKPVYLDNLNSPDLAKARENVYTLERKLLKQLVLKRLQKQMPRDFTPERITVSEEEVLLFYEQAGLRSRGTLKSFRSRIVVHLTEAKTRRTAEDLFNKAVRKGYVISYLRAPPPYTFRLKKVRRNAMMGPRNAPVQMVEFSDFQ